MDMETSPIENDIPITDLPDEPAFQKVKANGTITSITIPSANEKGNQFVQVEFEYPLEEVDRKKVTSGINVNLDQWSGKGLDALTDGQKMGVASNRRLFKELIKAAGIDLSGKGVLQAFKEVEGRNVKASIGPQKNEPHRPQYNGFSAVS